MSESNSIIDQVTSGQEAQDSFDASAFISSEAAKEIESVEGSPQEQQEVGEQDSDGDVQSFSETETENDNEFSWDAVEVEAKEEVESEEESAETQEDDWDSVESTTEEFDWNEVGQELGVEAKTKEEFVNQVKSLIENPVQDNETISELQEFIKRSDEELVIADMQASNFDEDYIEDTLNKLKESGLLKREAVQIRTQLQKFIQKERTTLKEQQINAERQAAEAQTNARKELQSHIKTRDEFFGGKVSSDEKRKLYNYITKGDFSKEIFETHANVAEAAFLWKNKDKIFKMVRTQGVEQGKSKILNNITSPSKNSRSQKSFVQTKTDGFDPKGFLK